MKSNFLLQILGLSALCWVSLSACQNNEKHTDIQVVVGGGQALQTLSKENKWQQQDSFLVSGDPFDELYANFYLLEGDFELSARLSLERIDSSTSLFLFFGHHFGFDSKPDGEDEGAQLFFYNLGTDQLHKLGPARQYIQPGIPFDFKLKRKSGQFEFTLNDQVVFHVDTTSFVMPLEGYFAFRPGENVMRLFEWEIIGTTRPLPPLDLIFTAGTDGYVCFRIPAVVKTKTGDLLAFAEARKENCWTDGRDIDIVMKRSKDGGASWSPLQVLWDDGPNTCAYPTPVVEQSTGRISLLACHNLGVDLVSDVISGKSQGRRSVFLMHSENGEEWTKPEDITEDVMLDDWSWLGMSSGAGIQLQNGDKKGRLVVASHHRKFVSYELYAHAMYSDDLGDTWQLGKPTVTLGGNESQVVELQDGRLLMNMRNYNKSAPNQRQIAISPDGGESWVPSWFDSTLVDPPCQASLLMFKHEKTPQGILLFANPPYISKRADLNLRASLDEGQSWPFQKIIFDGATAYSDLVQIDEDKIGILYECGHPFPYQGLAFEVISLSDWLGL